MGKNLLIVGGLGNLGSWLTRHFAQSGYNVYALGRFKHTLVEHFPFEFISCDITQAASCRQRLKGTNFNAVLYLANPTDVPSYPKEAQDIHLNAKALKNVLNALNFSSLEHFLYFSSFQVYGQYEGIITEKSPTTYTNNYAAAHFFAEQALIDFHLQSSIPYSIIRLTNTYGCLLNLHSYKWHLILNDLARSAFLKREIVLRSNGQAIRDFIWMGDVCKVVEQVLKLNHSLNDTFNLSGERTFQMLDIAQYVQEAYLSRYQQHIPIQINENDQTIHPKNLLVSSEKLKKWVSFNTEIRFHEEALNIFSSLT